MSDPSDPSDPLSERELLARVADVAGGVLLAATGRVTTPAPDEPLFGAGKLDSLSRVQLVLALQDEFDVILDEGDLAPTGLDTVRAIARTLMARRARG